MATIKPKTNIPLIGQLRYVNHFISTKKNSDGTPWPDQVGLKAEWEGEGEGVAYCPMWIKDMLFDLGLIEKPVDNDGNRVVDEKYGGRVYRVLGQPRIMLTKSETDEGVRWNVNLCDTAGANDQPRPSNMPCDKESAEANFPEQPPHPADRAHVDPVAATSKNELGWNDIANRLSKAMAIAADCHAESGLDVENERIFQTAVSVFIESGHRNLR